MAENNREVYTHLMQEEGFTMEASFSSHIITSFIYDLPFDTAKLIFELFLLEGEQAIIDILVGAITLKSEKIMTMADIDLMNYLRKNLVQEVFSEVTLVQVMPKQRVKLNYLETFQRNP